MTYPSVIHRHLVTFSFTRPSRIRLDYDMQMRFLQKILFSCVSLYTSFTRSYLLARQAKYYRLLLFA